MSTCLVYQTGREGSSETSGTCAEVPSEESCATTFGEEDGRLKDVVGSGGVYE